MGIRTVGVALCLLLSAPRVLAMCPYPTPKACSAFFESDAVFVGTVLSRQYCDNDEYIRFAVRVSRVLRGSVGASADVYTANDSARLPWEIGKEYVVFARLRRGRLESGDDCGPLSSPGRAAEIIGQIEELRGDESAWIEGEVRSSAPEGAGVADVLVRARDGGKTFNATTDSRGAFRLRVPLGHYQILVDPKLRTSDYNWYNLDDINLVRGQCAQLQLVPR